MLHTTFFIYTHTGLHNLGSVFEENIALTSAVAEHVISVFCISTFRLCEWCSGTWSQMFTGNQIRKFLRPIFTSMYSIRSPLCKLRFFCSSGADASNGMLISLFFIVFLNAQYLIIYYIPTNCTNLLFIYKQHIKTFVLFKLLKLLLHVSVTDWPSSGRYNISLKFIY